MREGRTLTLKAPKAAQLHPVAICQRFADGIKDGRHDAFYIAVVEVWIAGRQARNQFRLDDPQPP